MVHRLRDFSHSATQTVYDANGFLYKVVDAQRTDGKFATTYYQVQEMDARGNVTSATLADGVIDRHIAYNQQTGLVERIVSSTAGGATVLQDLETRWDNVNNLTYRRDRGLGQQGSRRDLTESFNYDGINQLTEYAVTGDVSHSSTVRYSDDGIGNIRYKSDVGDYRYNGTGPHAVSQAGSSNYSYDKNGNMIHGAGRSLSYTVFDKVARLQQSDRVTEFEYGTSRERYRRIDTHNHQRTTTLYLGSVEKVYHADQSVQWKRTIAGIAQVTINMVNGQQQNQTTHYLLKDHLGSTTAITDAQGLIQQTMAFDPWGARRQTDSWQALVASSIATDFYVASKPITTRGFTGHEMVDEHGIIHMNGRIYDPTLARFMQADPFIQSPTTIGSLNRYSYTLNNPLNATDPSGYFLKQLARKFGLGGGLYFSMTGDYFGASIMHAVNRRVAQNQFVAQYGATVAGTVASFFCGPCGIGVSALVSADIAYYRTGSLNAAIRAGGTTAAIGGIFYGVGLQFQGAELWQQALAHGVTGGVISVAQGGKFGHGFISAGASKFIMGSINAKVGAEASAGNDYAAVSVLAAAVVGGSISKLTGGKFANGAVTAAFAQLFNAVQTSKRAAAEKELNRLAKNIMSGSYSSAKEAAVALHTDQELMSHVKKAGLEAWAVIDKKTFSIKEIGFGSTHNADGVYDQSFQAGDSVWHSHPSGKDVWLGDLGSISDAGGRWIFASGDRLTGFDLWSTGYANSGQIRNDWGRGNINIHVYEESAWSTENFKF